VVEPDLEARRRRLPMFAAEVARLRSSWPAITQAPVYELAGVVGTEGAFIDWWKSSRDHVCHLDIEVREIARVRVELRSNEEAAAFLRQQADLTTNIRGMITSRGSNTTFSCEGGQLTLDESEFYSWLLSFDLGRWGLFAGNWDTSQPEVARFVLAAGSRFRAGLGV